MEWVYFQGTDDKLRKVKGDAAGNDLIQIGSNKTKSSPFAMRDASATDTFAVANFGEFPTHYRTVGIEVEDPAGDASFVLAPASASDNILAPGQRLDLSVQIRAFGTLSGDYALIVGYDSAGINDDGTWLRMLYPPLVVSGVATTSSSKKRTDERTPAVHRRVALVVERTQRVEGAT